MKFYLDENYKCHKNNIGNCREFDTTYFNGKADAVIEGYMFVPSGEKAMLNDEMVKGHQYTPWKPSTELDEAQRKYEKQLLSEYESALAELDSLVLNLQYNNLIK